MNTVSTGVMAGLMANGPVTLGMMKFREAETGESNPDSKPDMSFLSHLAYGTAFAVLYAMTESKVKASPMMKGGVLGLGVWGLSRLGVIPSLKLPPAGASVGLSHHSQMALAHLVWGASISQAVSSLKEKG